MIERIEFENFKSLRHATLPLGRFTLIVGPNGSGKSSVFHALKAVRDHRMAYDASLSTGSPRDSRICVKLLMSRQGGARACWTKTFGPGGPTDEQLQLEDGTVVTGDARTSWYAEVTGMRQFSFDAHAIAAPATVNPGMEIAESGAGLVNVLEAMRDTFPEQLDELNAQVNAWLPEFDRLLFRAAAPGQKALVLRQRQGRHLIPAEQLSQGTLIALAVLTLAYMPTPPALICLEEPDRGIHPRLLRGVQDAIYRLCYPEDHGEKRDPVQVIATTHAPYFLDLYKDHPEEVVIASKEGLDTSFTRLADMPHVQEMLGGASLGEIWYTGILGGVPVAP